VGSSQAVAWPATVLNTIVAESLDVIATELEKRLTERPTAEQLEQAVRSVLQDVVKKHRRACFDGNGYSAAWHKEAAKRGLPNYPSTAEALKELVTKKAESLFASYGVLTPRELHARHEIQLEQYCKIVQIEGRTLSTMVHTQILPAAMRAQGELAEICVATEKAGTRVPDAKAALRAVASHVKALRTALASLDASLAREVPDLEKRMQHCRKSVLGAIEKVRTASDELERRVPADIWPLPTYAQMLLMR
jgi:glutamine synthetase